MKQIKKRPTEVFGFDCDANLNEKAFRLAIKQGDETYHHLPSTIQGRERF